MKVIGIMGKAGSGKNTVAGILAATLVDQGFSAIVDAFGVDIKKCAREAGWDGVKDDTWRRNLQDLGNAMRRKDPDWLIALIDKRSFQAAHDYIIIADVRMPNEAEWCRRHGVLWHVFGRGGLDGPAGEDVTERLAVDDLPGQRTITSIVNSSSLEDLTRLVHMAVADGRHDIDLI